MKTVRGMLEASEQKSYSREYVAMMETSLKNMQSYIEEVGDSEEMSILVSRLGLIVNTVNGVILAQRKPSVSRLDAVTRILDDAARRMHKIPK
jgi:hypothetical protein